MENVTNAFVPIRFISLIATELAVFNGIVFSCLTHGHLSLVILNALNKAKCCRPVRNTSKGFQNHL